MNRQSLRLAAVAALPAATLVLGGLSLWALNGAGEARLASVPLMKLAAGYSRTAERLLASPAPSVDALDRARSLTRAGLREYPYDASGWLRLAYADAERHGNLTPEAIEYLRRSYTLVEADIYAGVWRIAFILEHTGAVPKDLRQSAKKETALLWRENSKRRELSERISAVQNPAGRLSGLLWLRRAQDVAVRDF